MAYTSAQLIAAYTAANNGVAPDAATTQLLTAFAAQTQTGQLSDSAALAYVLNSADNDVNVAVQAYQFFTGKTPTKAGLDYLVNSTTNTNDLNDAYYSQFNLENRYINFAVNLGILGEGATAFNTTYGSMNFTTFVGVAYETIIGSSYAQAAGINVAAAIADITSRQANFTAIARQAGVINASSTAAQVDIATKAALIGYLMAEGVKADVGLYAAGANNFVNALVNGNAQYNVNLTTVYSPLGGGQGSAVPGTGGNVGTTFNLTQGVDTVAGGNDADTINGVIYTNSGPASGFFTTLTAVDTINGGGGTDTLNVTITDSTGGATLGATAFPAASISNVEIINVRALSATAADVTTVNAANFAGETEVNADRSISAVTITNLGTGAAAGIIGNNSTANGALTFGYATASAPATLNVTGGTGPTGTAAPAVTVATAATSMTINSSGQTANTVGAIAVGGAATSLQVNASANLTTGNITGFAANATINVGGSVTTTSTTTPAVRLGVLENTVTTVNASGLTGAAGVGVTIGANAAVNFTGGAGLDLVTVGAGQGAALTGTINAAGGTDIIAFSTGADLVAGNASKFQNFETLRVSNAGGAATLQTYDPTLLTGITAYQVAASAGSVQLTNMAANPSVTVLGNLGGTNAAGALSLQLKDASGSADSVTVTLNNGNTLGAANTAGVTVGSAGNGIALGGTGTAGQVETLNLVSAGNITGTGAYNTVFLQAGGAGPNFADANTVKVTGSQGLSLTTAALVHAVTVDASTATGGLVFTSAAGGAFTVNVNGSTANDSITVAATQSGVIYGGAGGDLIQLTGAGVSNTITYKAGGDSLLDVTGTTGSSGTATANTGKMDIVQNFTTGVDKINLTDISGFNSAQVIADKGAVVGTTALNALLATSTFFQDSTNTLRKVAQFDVDATATATGVAGTLLVADINGNGTFDAGTDLVVLVGAVGNIANGDLVGS